jgi:hypothetical protein
MNTFNPDINPSPAWYIEDYLPNGSVAYVPGEQRWDKLAMPDEFRGMSLMQSLYDAKHAWQHPRHPMSPTSVMLPPSPPTSLRHHAMNMSPRFPRQLVERWGY